MAVGQMRLMKPLAESYNKFNSPAQVTNFNREIIFVTMPKLKSSTRVFATGVDLPPQTGASWILIGFKHQRKTPASPAKE